MALINSLKVMLQVSPFHRENYSRLILGVIIQYYQRCSDRFQDLTSSIPLNGDEPEIALAAQWAQQTELTPCLSELLISPVGLQYSALHSLIHFSLQSDLSLQQQLCKQETNLELGFLGQKNLTKSDLVPSVRNLAGLASLYHSIVRDLILSSPSSHRSSVLVCGGTWGDQAEGGGDTSHTSSP